MKIKVFLNGDYQYIILEFEVAIRIFLTLAMAAKVLKYWAPPPLAFAMSQVYIDLGSIYWSQIILNEIYESRGTTHPNQVKFNQPPRKFHIKFSKRTNLSI